MCVFVKLFAEFTTFKYKLSIHAPCSLEEVLIVFLSFVCLFFLSNKSQPLHIL